MTVDETVSAVLDNLSDDLRRHPWKGNPNPVAGHCYVASEAAFHLLGGKDAGWQPMFIRHEGAPHWFLRSPDGIVVDITAAQFEVTVPYENARRMAFLTKSPSVRARVLMDNIEKSIDIG